MVTDFKPTEWPFSKLLHAGIKFLDYNDQITIELLKTTVLRIKHLSHSEKCLLSYEKYIDVLLAN